MWVLIVGEPFALVYFEQVKHCRGVQYTGQLFSVWKVWSRMMNWYYSNWASDNFVFDCVSSDRDGSNSSQNNKSWISHATFTSECQRFSDNIHNPLELNRLPNVGAFKASSSSTSKCVDLFVFHYIKYISTTYVASFGVCVYEAWNLHQT